VELRELWRSVDDAPSLVAACTLATASASRVLGAPMAVLGRTDDGWELIVRSDVDASSAKLPDGERLAIVVARGRGGIVAIATDAQTVWTRVPIGAEDDPEWLLLLPGDWTTWPSTGWLRLFAQDLHRAFRFSAMKDAVRRRDASIATVYAVTRRLARLTGRAMHQAIVDAAAQLLGAEQVSLAIVNRRDGTLGVRAAAGYPLALVEALRISPGSGIIGRVFETRKPMLIDGGGSMAPRRLRYRSSSCVSVPLTAYGEVVGVLSATDPRDGRRFDRHDVSVMRWLCASTAGAVASDLLREECQEWQHAATVDPLTGLPNRRHFEARLQEELERARRYGLTLALLAIDVDEFKQVNDTRGHAAGDDLLRTVAVNLQRSVRAFDVCARIGGDEFAMLMPATMPADALHSAERLRERVAEQTRGNDGGAPLTVSIGVATLGPDDTKADLMARADRALYDAKRQGRNASILTESKV
jgi:diguanylate cyclase (GGDEF)-like protein